MIRISSFLLLVLSLIGLGQCGRDDSISSSQMAENIIAAISSFHDITVLPLGASIVYGYRSSNGNGFRADLVQQLDQTFSPKIFSMVGNVRSGNSSHSAFSNSVAWPGRVITEVHGNVTAFLSENACPDVTLIHAGTNDMNWNLDKVNAPKRMGDMLDTLYRACPKMSVLVAQLIMSQIGSTNSAIKKFNAQIPGLVDTRAKQGMKVMTVNMFPVVTADDMKDKIHPNDTGYLKMADQWTRSMKIAAAKGWF